VAHTYSATASSVLRRLQLQPLQGNRGAWRWQQQQCTLPCCVRRDPCPGSLAPTPAAGGQARLLRRRRVHRAQPLCHAGQGLQPDRDQGPGQRGGGAAAFRPCFVWAALCLQAVGWRPQWSSRGAAPCSPLPTSAPPCDAVCAAACCSEPWPQPI
jgi:hypothetical protein